jgi:serine/threonine-protein kinase
MVVDWNQPLERLKVMDFGLAKWVEGQASADTPLGQARPTGAAGYIAPEQISGNTPDPRSDIYSVGVILFELLIGSLPFRRPSIAETLQAHLHDPPPRFGDLDPAHMVPVAVEAIVQTCLAKQPGGRPASALILGQQLEEALAVKAPPTVPAIATAPPSAAPPVQRPKPTIPRLVRSTLHDDEAKPERDEAICSVAGFHADAGSVQSLEGFVRELGGRLVEKNPESMRAMLGVNLDPNSPPAKPGSGSSSTVKLILTELEFTWEARRPDQPLKVAFRPLSNVSVSLANAWRGGCERIQAQLEAHLLG